MNSNNRKNLLILFLVVLFDLIGFGMIIPLIPYLGKTWTTSPVMVGLLMSIYSVMQFLFSPFWGGLSDRYGRKPILLLSILGAALSHTLFAFSTSYLHLFLTRLFAGLFSANISCAMAAASDVSTKEQRTQTMGLIGAAFGLGFVLGPLFGALGAGWGVSLGWGEEFSSLIAGVLSFLNFIFCFVFFSETLQGKHQKLRINFQKLNPISSLILTPFKVRLSVGLFFMATMSLALIEVVLFLVMSESYSWSYIDSAFGFAIVGVIMAFTQGGLIRPLKKRYSETQIIFVGGLLFGIGLLTTAFFDPLLYFGLGVITLSFGYALLNPSLTGLISIQSPQDSQGSTFGLTHGFSALSRIIGPIAGTVIFKTWGTKAPFLFSGLLILLSLLVFFGARRKT